MTGIDQCFVSSRSIYEDGASDIRYRFFLGSTTQQSLANPFHLRRVRPLNCPIPFVTTFVLFEACEAFGVESSLGSRESASNEKSYRRMPSSSS